MTPSKKLVSIVVAAYNEESIISANLGRIVSEISSCPDIEWELLCVNDGSGDSTGREMDAFAARDSRVKVFHHRRNFGQGRALRTAFDCAKGHVIVTLDADLSYGPEYIRLLIDAVEKNNVEIALASPYAKGGLVRNVPLYRHFLSRAGNWYLAQLSHYDISTSTCVVRAYSRDVIDSLEFTSDGMELQLEILMKASMAGFRVIEVPAKLEWAADKVQEADFRRVSKMRILRTIRLYLLMGWLSRPALLFILVALSAILPGAYMASVLVLKAGAGVLRNMDSGLVSAVSSSLKSLYESSAYSIAICAALLIIGFQILVFSLLMLQNKFYFEELNKLLQRSLKKRG